MISTDCRRTYRTIVMIVDSTNAIVSDRRMMSAG
jgi:hypothetical protein